MALEYLIDSNPISPLGDNTSLQLPKIWSFLTPLTGPQPWIYGLKDLFEANKVCTACIGIREQADPLIGNGIILLIYFKSILSISYTWFKPVQTRFILVC